MRGPRADLERCRCRPDAELARPGWRRGRHRRRTGSRRGRRRTRRGARASGSTCSARGPRRASTRSRVAGRQPPEQAADQHHDLPVRVVVGAGQRLLDVLVPPLRPVPHLAVVQQVLLQLGEARAAGRRSRRRRRRRAGPPSSSGASASAPWPARPVRSLARQPLEDVVGRAVHEHQLDARACPARRRWPGTRPRPR